MISIAQDIVLLQPSKAVMLIVVVVLALTMRRKGHDDALVEDDLLELSSEDLSESDSRNYEMERLRKRKTMEASLMRFAVDLLWHLLFMFLLAIVCYGHKDGNRFLMTTSVKQALPYFYKVSFKKFVIEYWSIFYTPVN